MMSTAQSVDALLPDARLFRTRILRTTLAFAVVVLLGATSSVVGPASSSAQTASGSIHGRVTNGSKGGAAVQDLPVTLLPVSSAGPGQRQMMNPDPSGAFKFEGLG